MMDKMMIFKLNVSNNLKGFYLVSNKFLELGIKALGKKELNSFFYGIIEEIKHNGYMISGFDGEGPYFYTYNETYKIIGEISPKAIQLGYIYDGMEIGLNDYYYMPVEERKYAGYLESELPLIEVMNPNDGILY